MKEKTIVRLEKIWIKNFKNVVSGQLNFENNRKPYKASVLGLYGQNGSGKTALIDAVELLKLALSGMPVPVRFANCINVNADYATLKYELKIQTNECNYTAMYEFCIKKEEDDSLTNSDPLKVEEKKYKTIIFDEILSYSYVSKTEKCRMSPLIDTKVPDVFGPKTKYDMLVGKSKEMFMDLLIAKRVTATSSRSFIFSKELLNIVKQNYLQLQQNKVHLEIERHWTVLDALVKYGNYQLFVINTANSGLISMNALPLSFMYELGSRKAVGQMAIVLDRAMTIPEDAVKVLEKIVPNMNIVLEQIVPGLTISVKKLGQQLMEDGRLAWSIQLMSNKNHKEIPLQYESEGIKKIVSILQLLIVVYNNPAITVAIDELDSGVFEYLLGELLKIISEKGKGQLIFTSHNLRPLETIDRGFVAFTTTNANNRYIRLSNVKENNNLRDFYFRDIVLGEQNEELYMPTNNFEIALAFREAGELIGS